MPDATDVLKNLFSYTSLPNVGGALQGMQQMFSGQKPLFDWGAHENEAAQARFREQMLNDPEGFKQTAKELLGHDDPLVRAYAKTALPPEFMEHFKEAQ